MIGFKPSSANCGSTAVRATAASYSRSVSLSLTAPRSQRAATEVADEPAPSLSRRPTTISFLRTVGRLCGRWYPSGQTPSERARSDSAESSSFQR
ncbi:MAG: hypothetical protein ACJAXA_002359 [Candidatus Aldehydirespiratoraceae bacterium]|jgi:hypothetical protein